MGCDHVERAIQRKFTKTKSMKSDAVKNRNSMEKDGQISAPTMINGLKDAPKSMEIAIISRFGKHFDCAMMQMGVSARRKR